jgi:tetratricopeptide (TPR) repeat protein
LLGKVRAWLTLVIPGRVVSLLENAVHGGNRTDLDEAIALLRRMLNIAGEGSPYRAAILTNLSFGLVARHGWSGSLTDLEEAVETGRQAVSASPDGDPDRALYLANFLSALQHRYERSGSLADLEEAIETGRRAVSTTFNNPLTCAAYLSNVGVVLRMRYERFGTLPDLELAIEAARKAVSIIPDGHPGHGTCVTRLSVALLSRFERFGSPADLNEAVEASRQAVYATSQHRSDSAMYLSNFGNASWMRYERFGSLPDLDEAIEAYRAAVAASPEGCLEHAFHLSGLSNVLRTRYWRSGSLADADQAIDAARQAVSTIPDDHPDRAGCLSNLGTALRSRSWQSESLLDLDEAIEACRQAVTVTPDDRPIRGAFLSNLSNTLQARYLRTGSLAALDEAIEVGYQAVTAIPEDHLNRALPLSNLGTALHNRFERSGSLPDLEQAIEASRQAVSMTPDDDPGHAAYLMNLGVTLLTRFERRGSLPDLYQAIEAHRQALAATPDGITRSTRLSSLGIALLTRYQRSASLPDLNEAIEAGRQAAGATPGDHPIRVIYELNLSNALLTRYQRSGGLPDLNEAIEAGRQAVTATPGDHPNRAACLHGLSNALAIRYQRSGSLPDLDQAIEASREAESVDAAPPRVRVQAAIWWGRLTASAARWNDAAAGFEAAVILLGRVAPRSLSRPDQEHALGSLAGLASDAAACCVRAGLPDRAVELLEQGRGILLGQALDTRSDLTALAEQHPGLADRFTSLRDALDQVSHPSGRLPIASGQADGTVELRAAAWVAGERQRTTAESFEQVITEIRSQPGFSGFLRPLPVRDLRAAAADGPVALVNVSRYGSHALILTANGVLDPVLLDEVTPARVTDRVTKHLNTLGNPLTWTTLDLQLTDMLGWLWDTIAGPVLDRLGLTGLPADGQPWPRLWWCLPGLLSFLPMHAAGHHSPADAAPESVIDRVISSYTPTLRGLLHARRAPSRPAGLTAGDDQAVVVAMPHTAGAPDIPGALAEATMISQRLGAGVLTLTGSQATRESVMRALPAARWAHFACHGTASVASPSDSSLLLADHQRLTVSDIAQLRLNDADLAYLSACSTAQPGTQIPDEAIHLASAFELAGYRHVIGTLWPIADDAALKLADGLYAALADTKIPTSPARTLHTLTRFLRDRQPHTPKAWASHIHIGA